MYLVVEIIANQQEVELLQQLCYDDQCFGLEELNEKTFQLTYPIEKRTSITNRLNQLKENFQFEYHFTELSDKNWNELWEQDYHPIYIDQFCAVYAPFHDRKQTCKHEIVINPEMAFGTGHHDTTQLMIQMMSDIDLSGKSVLDLGSGTGVLAILAAKENAHSVVAIDIDPKAVDIMKTNFVQNGEDGIIPILGQINSVQDRFNVILANITKNTILSVSDSIDKRLDSGGILICSGFLKDDAKVLIKTFASQNYKHLMTKYKNSWSCISFEKQ